MAREGVSVGGGGRGGGGGGNVSDALRIASKQEAEKYFDYVLREDRSVDEFLASDYTFLNDTLASAYKIKRSQQPGISQGHLAARRFAWRNSHGGQRLDGHVQSHSHFARQAGQDGSSINILGAPTPPPPPNIPALEDTKPKDPSHVPTLRETLAVHREDALCASCHKPHGPARASPWKTSTRSVSGRTEEFKQKIDSAGQLATGETFTGIGDLKRIFAAEHKLEFYRCLTEKLLTYALGRGVEYYDVPNRGQNRRYLGPQPRCFFSFIDERNRVRPLPTAAHVYECQRPRRPNSLRICPKPIYEYALFLSSRSSLGTIQ